MPSHGKSIDERKLRLAAAVVVYLVGAFFVAYWIGVQQVYFLYLSVLVVGSIILTTTLQKEVWVLILLGWSLTASTAMFSLPISMRDIAVLLTAVAYFCYRALSPFQGRLKWHVLDAVLGINLVYLAFTFILHPVGLRALGAETIGGRPYFTIFLAIVGYWVIWRLPTSIKTVSRIPLFILAGSTVAGSLSALAYVFPSLPGRIPYLYAALSVEAYFSQAAVMKEAMGSQIVRYKELGFFGVTLLTTMFAYTPSLVILNPLRPRFYALAVGAICVFLSGFRNLLAAASALFGISVWLHRGFVRFLMTCAVGGALLLALTAGQGRVYDLPFSVQRTLSLLPGRWDPLIVIDTEASTEGRIKWWRDVFTYNLINNWWFGDGFGASEMDVALASESRRGGEVAFVTGALHSGPLTAIRYVGVVGLLLLYALMITAVVSSVRCVQRCRGTMLQPLAIYLAVQLIWFPIGYTLIFGAYNIDMPQMIFLAALLRLLMRMSETMPTGKTQAAGLSGRGTTQPLVLKA